MDHTWTCPYTLHSRITFPSYLCLHPVIPGLAFKLIRICTQTSTHPVIQTDSYLHPDGLASSHTRISIQKYSYIHPEILAIITSFAKSRRFVPSDCLIF